MIWGQIVEATPIMMFSASYSDSSIPPQTKKLGARVLRPEEVNQTCGWHPNPKSIKKSERFSLSWLRACRWVYHEARLIVYSRIKLHVCDPAALARFRQQIPRSTRQLFHSLELGLKLTTRPAWRADEGASLYPFNWPKGHTTAGSISDCRCPCCIHGSDRLDLASYFPSLHSLRLKIYFQCEGKGRLYNGEIRAYNGTYRPKNPLPLECASHPNTIANQVSGITTFFSDTGLGSEIQTVNVRFLTKTIEHDEGIICQVPGSCWCEGLVIDKRDLEKGGLAAKIERCLQYNLNALVEYYPGWRAMLIREGKLEPD